MYPINGWYTETTGGRVWHSGYWLGCAWQEVKDRNVYNIGVAEKDIA